MLLVESVGLTVPGEDLEPLDGQLEYLLGELVYLFEVGLRCLLDQGDEGVEVEVEFAPDELGALGGRLEAPELTLQHPFDLVEQSHLVGVVEVELPDGHLLLPGVAIRVLPEVSNPGRAESHNLHSHQPTLTSS